MTDGDSGKYPVDTSVAHPARTYDWLLGGRDNYPVDEVLGRKILAVDPTVPETALANRRFMQRSALWLAQEAGVTQFIDLGSGHPTEANLHQIVQGVTPQARIAYVDNDRIVLSHAAARMSSTPEGDVNYLLADIREVDRIVELAGETMDFSKPIAVSANAVLHFLSDQDDAYGVMRRLVEPLARGSYLTVTHVTGDFRPEYAEKVVALYGQQGTSLRPRTHSEVRRFFQDMDLVEPGLVLAPQWRPELGAESTPASDVPVHIYAGVARKP